MLFRSPQSATAAGSSVTHLIQVSAVPNTALLRWTAPAGYESNILLNGVAQSSVNGTRLPILPVTTTGPVSLQVVQAGQYQVVMTGPNNDVITTNTVTPSLVGTLPLSQFSYSAFTSGGPATGTPIPIVTGDPITVGPANILNGAYHAYIQWYNPSWASDLSITTASVGGGDVIVTPAGGSGDQATALPLPVVLHPGDAVSVEIIVPLGSGNTTLDVWVTSATGKRHVPYPLIVNPN